jgi:pimeloyl-ACP methyl ester carboxylesterase
VSLTGLGERVHLGNPQVDLETHVSDIVNLLEFEDLREVYLVGHSYGGFPVTGAADRIPERIAEVLYVDSGPFPDGTPWMEVNSPEEQAAIEKQVAEFGDGWRIPVPEFDPGADPVNLAGLDDVALGLMRSRGVPHPFGTATQPLRLANPARDALPKTLISSTFPLDQVREMVAARHPWFAGLAGPNSRFFALPTGHWPMFSRPADLAALLAELPTG